MSQHERHLQLAMDAATPTERSLHQLAARAHAQAHLSEVHRRAAVGATARAFDARLGGTVIAQDGDQPRDGDGRFSMSERHEMSAKAHEAEAAKGGKDAEAHKAGAAKHRAAGEAHGKGDADADAKTGHALMHEPYIPFPGWQKK